MESLFFSVDNSVEPWDNEHERWWGQKLFLTAGSARNSVDDSVDDSVDPWNHEAECWRGKGRFWMADSASPRPKIRKSFA